MLAVIAVTDLLARSRLQEAAGAAGYEVLLRRQVPDPADVVPDILVVDLDMAGALAAVTAWCQAHPETRVVGFAFHAEENLIAEAKAAGVEVVPHGATARPGRIFS